MHYFNTDNNITLGKITHHHQSSAQKSAKSSSNQSPTSLATPSIPPAKSSAQNSNSDSPTPVKYKTYIYICRTCKLSIRSSSIHFACIGIAPPRLLREQSKGSNPMKAKWIELDLSYPSGFCFCYAAGLTA